MNDIGIGVGLALPLRDCVAQKGLQLLVVVLELLQFLLLTPHRWSESATCWLSTCSISSAQTNTNVLPKGIIGEGFLWTYSGIRSVSVMWLHPLQRVEEASSFYLQFFVHKFLAIL